jgi:hypothetical protein
MGMFVAVPAEPVPVTTLHVDPMALTQLRGSGPPILLHHGLITIRKRTPFEILAAVNKMLCTIIS